jgi:hypothetical protein
MTNKQFAKQLNDIKKRLTKDRDDLRLLLEEAGSLDDCADHAVMCIGDAADALSELL